MTPADESDEATPEEQEPPALLPIEEVIDLHGFQPRDIPSVVEEYLREAHARGFREVRLIHGRGTGFQRQRVQQLLAQHPLVERFADAPAHRGGWGATLVWLNSAGSSPHGSKRSAPSSADGFTPPA